MKKRLISMLLTAALLLSLCPVIGLAAYTPMQFSDGLVQYIKNGEGFLSQPYTDGTGNWYIGYGCLINRADYPYGITEAGADGLLRQRMQSFADTINRFFSKYDVTLTQGQFDAMCALSYALGPAWLSTGSRLVNAILQGTENYTDAELASALGAYCHVGGVVNTGALRRRIMEAKMFLYGDYSFTAEGWTWLILKSNGGEIVSDVALFKVGEPYGSLPEASRSGWYFAGWQKEDGTLLSAEETATAAHTVTATWSTVPPAEPEPGVFPDVPETEWYAETVRALAEAGVVHGYEDGTFRPENDVTWGEALKLVLLAAAYPEQTAEKDAHWAAGYRKYAVEQSFLPDAAPTDLEQPISRDAVADLCCAALGLEGSDIESPFADSSRPSVLALYGQGILLGNAENGALLYKGGDALSRAELCAIVRRVTDYTARTVIRFLGYRIPINFDLNMNGYAPEDFSGEPTAVRYAGDVRYGIDVSEHQGSIDWQKVAADGVDFAMIRCGLRSYGSDGKMREDLFFRDNIRGALDAGLDVGIYFFSQALNETEAQEEADLVLSLLEGYDVTFPVTFDWEQITVAGARTNRFDGGTVTRCAEVFCDAMAAAGYTPMIYFNPSMAYLRLNMERIQAYPNWLANYQPAPQYVYDFQMWQYTSSGSVSGISGRVDRDIAFVDFAEE